MGHRLPPGAIPTFAANQMETQLRYQEVGLLQSKLAFEAAVFVLSHPIAFTSEQMQHSQSIVGLCLMLDNIKVAPPPEEAPAEIPKNPNLREEPQNGRA